MKRYLVCGLMLVLVLGTLAALSQESSKGPQSRPVIPPEIGLIVDHVLAGLSTTAKAEEARSFHDAFLASARIRVAGNVSTSGYAEVDMKPEEFLSARKRGATEGLLIREIARHVDTFGGIAHVFSTYEARHAPEDRFPFARGIIGIQMIERKAGWRVAGIAFSEDELSTMPIPDPFLPR